MEENVEKKELAVNNFANIQAKNVEREVFTTLNDEKVIFNLEDNCDFKVNDCKGEKIRVKDVLIKKIQKKLKKPVIDEETGEVLKEYETSLVTILIDEQGKSYVTASKSFGFKFINYINTFGVESIKKGLEIEITERAVKNSNNKALSFVLV